MEQIKKERKQRTSILSFATPEELATINEIKQRCKARAKAQAANISEEEKIRRKIYKYKAKIAEVIRLRQIVDPDFKGE